MNRRPVKRTSTSKQEPYTFWSTTAGVITAAAALISAITGAIVLFRSPDEQAAQVPTTAFVTALATTLPDTPTGTAPSVTSLPSGELALSDDFSNNDNNWGLGSDSNTAASITSGKLRMSVQTTTEAKYRVISIPKFEGDDFLLKFDLTLVNTPSNKFVDDNSMPYFQIIFRENDNSGGVNGVYIVKLRAHQYSIEAFQDRETPIPIVPWTEDPEITIEPGVRNTLVLSAKDNDFKLQINDHVISEYRDTKVVGENDIRFGIVADSLDQSITFDIDDVSVERL